MSKLYRKINGKYVEVGDDMILSQSYFDHCKMYGAHLIYNTKNHKGYRSLSHKDINEVTEKVISNLKQSATCDIISQEIYSKVSDDIFGKSDKPRNEFIDYLLNKNRISFPSDAELVKIIIYRLCEYDCNTRIENMNK